MTNKFTLGVIGAGNMASAIVGGIVKSGVLAPNQIIVSDKEQTQLDKIATLGIYTTLDNIKVAQSVQYLLFAIKPQSFEDIANEISPSLQAETIISIMAGVSIAKLKKHFENCNYARIMPNTPAFVGEGMSAIAFSDSFYSQFVVDVFSSIGKVELIDEKYFDAVTSLSGSGPAYVYMFINALIQGGMQGSLDFQTAKTLALQTVKGAVKMIESSTKPIDELVDAVCSKGGTTICAVESFKKDNLEKIITNGITKCRERSIELSGASPKTTSDKKDVTIYTDGACSVNPGVGGWAAILMSGSYSKEICGSEPNTTNNRMELQAIIKGLKLLKQPCKVTVYSDSAYSVDAFLKGWIYGWMKNGWKTSSKDDVKNVDLWQELLSLTKKHDVEFVKVKGHADNEFNNRCDTLAKGAIKQYQDAHPIGDDIDNL